jgi:hypothetical protein
MQFIGEGPNFLYAGQDHGYRCHTVFVYVNSRFSGYHVLRHHWFMGSHVRDPAELASVVNKIDG